MEGGGSELIDEEHAAEDLIGVQLPRLIRQAVEAAPVRGWALVVTTADATATETRNGFTFTIAKCWVNGDPQDATHKVDVIVPVAATVAAGQLWVAATDEAVGHLSLVCRYA